MDVNFELYKVFYYVARYLSFSEASNRLFISQSAVSQSIKLLEEKLNCKLLFRSTKQVQLTQEGKVLFGHIEQAFNFIKTGERNIAEMHSMLRGEVRIGASDTICKYYLLPYFKKFNEIYPNIKIHITNRTSPMCVELLKKGNVDFCVINIPLGRDYPGMNMREVRTIKDVFIAGENFNHLRNKVLSVKDLKGYPLIVLEKNTTTRDFFDDFLKRNHVNLVPEIELGSVDLLIEMASIGLGISYVMAGTIENQLSQGSIFTLNIKEELPSRGLGIITHSNLPLTVAAQRFIDLLA